MLKRPIYIVILMVYLTSSIALGRWYWHVSYHQQIEASLIQLNRFSDQLNSLLEKYAYIPQLLAKDGELVDALLAPSNSAQIEITSRYLNNVNQIIQASDTYLLNREGTTIAASNWQLQTSFIGRNFAFRPYYQQAIAGDVGQYFALGSTSGKRGFYYAFPVRYAGAVIGIVVVKTTLIDVEKSWNSRVSDFVASDANNIIFMSSNPAWLYKSLFTISAAVKQQVQQEQRYLSKKIGSLAFTQDHPESVGEITKGNTVFYRDHYLSAKSPLKTQQLTLRVLTPKVTVFWQLFEFMLLLNLLFALLLVTWLLIRHRQIRHQQIARIEQEAKEKLAVQVTERTAALHLEIDEREKTELMLRQTQEELIQAAKLAVLGQMSASISHELNNPLAAIRSFAENGKRFLAKGEQARAEENLTRISALTDRMATISQQLKSFARKTTSDDRVDAKLYPVIISAVDLLKPQLRANQIQLTIAINEQDKQVQSRVNLIQLEQVLINLLSNAIEALNHSDNHSTPSQSAASKQIEIHLEIVDPTCLIHIDDNGPGLAVETVKQLFEPFYTTKQNGLGLGLSISTQIMQTMGGNLTANQSPMHGGRFTIALEISSNQGEA